MSSLLQTIFDLWHNTAAAPSANQADASTAAATGTAAAAPALTASAPAPTPPASPPASSGSQSADAGAGGGADGGAGGGTDAGPQQPPPYRPMPDIMARPPGGLILDAGPDPDPAHLRDPYFFPSTPADSLPGPQSYDSPDYDPRFQHDPSGAQPPGPDWAVGLQWDTTAPSPGTPQFNAQTPGMFEGSGNWQFDPTKPPIPPNPAPTPPPLLNQPGPQPPMAHVQSMTHVQSTTHVESTTHMESQNLTPSFHNNAILNPDGTSSTHYPDGTQDVRAPDGTCWRLAPSGTVTQSWQEPPAPQWQPPQSVAAAQPDGGMVVYHPDGSKELWHGGTAVARFDATGHPST
ncbi:hypothetical protein [Catenulispora rubra]|uniref:hypothetical protein n=1 Tax=Catenulispora rubra TaxID=280293 RepID=UPI00189273C4|nr:hypothetical protein [Catenulispora rubra]